METITLLLDHGEIYKSSSVVVCANGGKGARAADEVMTFDSCMRLTICSIGCET